MGLGHELDKRISQHIHKRDMIESIMWYIAADAMIKSKDIIGVYREQDQRLVSQIGAR